MSEALNQRGDFNMAVPGIPGKRSHFINTDRLRSADNGLSLVSQLIFEFKNHGIDLISGKPVNAFIIVIHVIKVVLYIKMNCPESQYRVISDNACGNRLFELLSVLKKLFKSLASVEYSGIIFCLYLNAISPYCENITFRRRHVSQNRITYQHQ